MYPSRGNAKVARRHENLSQKPQQSQEEREHRRDEEQRYRNGRVEVRNALKKSTAMTVHTSSAVAVHSVMAGPINLAR